MAYEQKYYYTFYGLNGVEYTVSIDEDTAGSITPVEVRGNVSPFTVEYPELQNKYAPVFSSGCTINLLSAFDRQFFDLFTAEMQQYRIRLLVAGAVKWIGLLDTEIYHEDFSSVDNYPISFTGNDGFNILDRILFVDSDGNNIDTITSCWAVLTTIIQKLKIKYNYIYFASSTTSAELDPTSSQTILHKTYVNCRNFIDEEDKPMTCRDVLESILKIHYLRISQQNGSLYIWDNNLALDDTITFKGFDATWFTYFGNSTQVSTLGDLSDIGFMSNNQQLDSITAVNKQRLTFSPYPVKELISFEDGKGDFSTVNDSVTYHSGDMYGYQDIYYTNSTKWNKQNYGYFVERKGLATSELNKDFSEMALFLDKAIPPVRTFAEVLSTYAAEWNTINFTYKKQLPYVIPTDAYLKLELQIYVNTKSYLNMDSEVAPLVNECILGTVISIGSKVYTKNEDVKTGTWADYTGTLSDNCNIRVFEKSGLTTLVVSPISNRWVTIGNRLVVDDNNVIVTPVTIPLNTGVAGGVLDFKIKNYFSSTGDRPITLVQSTIKDVRIKGVKITVCDKDGNEIVDNDKEYTAYFNKSFKNEGSQVKTILGTNVTGNPVERGALMYHDGTQYNFISQHTRKGVTDTIENLLLRSIQSNYIKSTLKFSCSINLLNTAVGYITYSNYLAENFIPVAVKHDYSESVTEITLNEVSEDNLTLVKSF